MTVHIIGAGLAGLSAAVRLATAGQRIALYEAAPQAGGRCRSYLDRTLNRVIDNGNHLMLSGNSSLLDYLKAIGAETTLVWPKEAHFPFVDLETGARWVVGIDGGRWTRWLRDPTRNVPGASLFDRMRGWRLPYAPKSATVAGSLRNTGVLWKRFWEPMAVAVMNTPPGRASAFLLWAALKESVAKGREACRPLIARDSLAASLVDPAIALLTQHRADLFFGQRLRLIDFSDRANALHFSGLEVALQPDDHVILALPPGQIAELLPGVPTPSGAHAIVNAHFLLPKPISSHARAHILGIIGGEAHWIFIRGEVASVTVSAADMLAEEASDTIASLLWSDVARALEQPIDPVPPCRVIKEKRATFSQTPESLAHRPPTRTKWKNIHLAGDWTDTGLPATIEGAVRSGQWAADAAHGGETSKRRRRS
jgi:squalene-associated FAD-dependent desaturase